MKVKFRISGMTCAACSARVTKAANAVKGVCRAEVNLLTGSMTAELDGIEPADVVAAIERAGYGAAVDSGTAVAGSDARKMMIRFLLSLVFMIPLFYIAMGHHMNWALGALKDQHMWIAVVELCLTVPIVALNYRYFTSGTTAVFRRSPNMDTLVAVGAGVSILYSLYATVVLIVGHFDPAAHGVGAVPEIYYESAGMILTLITLGKWLETVSKRKTTAAISKMLNLAPKTAELVTEGGAVKTIPAAEIAVGDVLRVFPGGAIAVDGRVVKGSSAVDESMLSGESLPVDKEAGSVVFAGTANTTGSFDMTAEKVGDDTSLAGIVRLMEEASSSKLPISRVADRVSGVFVPVVMGIALVTLIVWLSVGTAFAAALKYAVSVLVISCPCALGLATPVAIMVGTGKGAENGILIRSAEALEHLRTCKTVILDKTGTITTGKPDLAGVYSSRDTDEMLKIAAALESYSEHVLAQAIVRGAEGVELPAVEGFEAVAGSGITGIVGGTEYRIGKQAWLEGAKCASKLKLRASAGASTGQTPVFLADEREVLAVFLIADKAKPDAADAVALLKRSGIRVVMLTGDNNGTAAVIAKQIGIDEWVAEVRPEDKDRIVAEYREHGNVAMVGDGINDAPALLRADVGIAIGAGTDVAIEAADVVLQGGELLELVDAMRLSRATIRNIKQNLFWAFLYNTVAIPVAAGAFVPIGFGMDPMIAAAAMSLSSVCVVVNALRLRLFKPTRSVEFGLKRSPRARSKERVRAAGAENGFGQEHTAANKTSDGQEPGGQKMKKVIKIEGMMCAHCVQHIRQATEALGVSAAVDLEKGICEIEGDTLPTDTAIKKAIADEGYTVTEIL